MIPVSQTICFEHLDFKHIIWIFLWSSRVIPYPSNENWSCVLSQQRPEHSNQRREHLKFILSSNGRAMNTMTSFLRTSISYRPHTVKPWILWPASCIPQVHIDLIQQRPGQRLGHLKFILSSRHSLKESKFLSSPNFSVLLQPFWWYPERMVWFTFFMTMTQPTKKQSLQLSG